MMKMIHTWKIRLTALLLMAGAVLSYAQAPYESYGMSADVWGAAGMSESMALTSLAGEAGSGYHLAYENSLGQLQHMYVNGTNLAFTGSTNTGMWKVESARFYPNEASGAMAKMYFYKSTSRWLSYDSTNDKYVITTTSGNADNRLMVILTGEKHYLNGTGAYSDGVAPKGWDNYPMVWYDAYLFYKTTGGKYVQVGVKDSKLTRVNTGGTFDSSLKVRLYAGNGQRVLKLHRNEDPAATAQEAKEADDYTLVNYNVANGQTQLTAPYTPTRAGYTFLGWATTHDAVAADARYLATTWPLNKPEGSSNRWEYTGDALKKYVLNLYAVWQQEKVWKVEYGYNASMQTVAFTTDPTDARYMVAEVTASPEVQSGGRVYFKITSEGLDGTNKQWWGFQYGDNHEPEKNGSWSTFSTLNDDAQITACKNTATYTLRLDVSDINNPKVTVMWPYVISVYNQSETSENGMWAFTKGEGNTWSLDFTLPSTIANIDGAGKETHLWVGPGVWADGHSANWSFGWIPFTRLKNLAVCNRTVGAAAGAKGTLYINAASNEDNYALTFDPVGYAMMAYTAGNEASGVLETLHPTSADPTIWETDLITSLQYDASTYCRTYVNKVSGTPSGFSDIVAASRTIEANSMSVGHPATEVPQKKNATDYYADNLAIKYKGRAGKFRIDTKSCEANWDACFVPYIHCLLNENAPMAELTVKSWTSWENLRAGAYYSVEAPDAERSMTIPPVPWTREGYTFKCWDTDPNGLGRTVYPGETFTFDEALILDEMHKNDLVARLYAQWLKNDQVTYHINLPADDRTKVQNTVETKAQDLLLCEDWVNAGYAIAGWAISPSGNIVYEAGGQIITMGIDLDLYAVWRPTVTITYDENIAVGSHTYQSVVLQNTGCDLRRFRDFRADVPSWDHSAEAMRFAGWNTQADGLGFAYEDGERITPTADMTLYAQWDVSCVIRFFPNGADKVSSMTSVTVASHQDYTLKANTFTWNEFGHYFIGWATSQADADAGIVTYHNQEVIRPTGSIDLYAVWRTAAVGEYVIFRCNTSTGKGNNQIGIHNTSKAIVSTTLGNHTDICIVWKLEDTGNGSQFYMRNYVNSDYYLCCDASGALSVRNDGTKTAWNRDDGVGINNFYYTDLDMVNHYIVWDATWKTVTSGVADYKNEVIPGYIVHRDFLVGSIPSTTIYNELISPKSPTSVYNSDPTGKQTINFQFSWSTEEYFQGYSETWNYYYKIVSRTKQAMTDKAASYTLTEKTSTGFTFVEKTAAFNASKNTYTVPLQVTPIDGASLKNQKSLGKYVDYCDSVFCSVTIDTMHLTKAVAMIRRTYYEKDDDRVSLWFRDGVGEDITEFHYAYDDLSTVKVGMLTGHHFNQKNEYYSYNDELLRHTAAPSADHDIVVDLQNVTPVDAFVVNIVDDETGAVATWATATLSTNTISVQMTEQNNLGRIRTARLIITHRHTETVDGDEKTLLTSRSVEISQGSRFTDTDGDLLVRNKGVKNIRLDERGLQKVHTQEQTFYYLPGEDIVLEPRERHMWGWQLWYDYDNLTRIPESMAAFPNDYYCKDNTTKLKLIGNGENAQGVYGTQWAFSGKDDTEPMAVAKVTLHIPDTYTGTHRIAGEFSNYMDYGTTFNTQNRVDGAGNVIGKLIYEPTLSYRQIWTLAPASEMAAKMEASKTGNFVESYKYTACAEQGVTLAMEHHLFHYTNKSQLGYIYQDADGHYHRVGDKSDAEALQPKAYITFHGVKREIDVQAVTTAHFDEANDYLIIDGFHSDQPGDSWDGVSNLNIIYSLEAGDYKIAKWDVTYIPRAKVGPLTETDGKALITSDEIHSNYIVLSESNFDYNKPLNEAITYYGTPLSWEESSSGFYYHNTDLTPVKSHKNITLPFRGEYAFVNTTRNMSYQKYCSVFENRTGVEDGYFMYVDASSAPGLISMLNVEKHLCSGQKMYCSAWIGNSLGVNRDATFADPSLRFDIRGKNKGDSEWHAVQSFLTGELPKNTRLVDGYYIGQWWQINFEIDLTEDYDNYQIAIYDFAPTGKGNDFVLDDIIIYANELPLEAYQASTSCSTNSVKSVIRMDYEAAKEDMAGTTLFYQVWNNTDNTYVPVEPSYRQAEDQPAYAECGSIAVPSRGQTPVGDKFASLSAMIQKHDQDVEAHQAWEEAGRVGDEPTIACMGFVKEHINNTTRPELNEDRFVLYLVHDAPMTSEKNYEVRVAFGHGDLANTQCALTAALPVTNAYELLINGETQTSLTPTTCGNDEFSLSMNVNTILIDPATGNQVKLTGETMNDWLLLEHHLGAAGQPDVDPTEDFDIHTWRSKALSQDSAAGHGYSFDAIERAIVYNLRKEANDNPNRFITSLSQIDVAYLGSASDYRLISDLVLSGELSLGVPNTDVYIRPNDLIRYAVMPIMGSAYDQNGDQISMCYAPSLVAVAAPPYSDYKLDNGKVPLSELPEQLRGKPTRIRVALNQAEKATINMQLIERLDVILPDQMCLVSSTDPNFKPDQHWLAFEPDKKYNFGGVTTDYYDSHNDVCVLTMIPKSKMPAGKTFFSMRAGYEYTFQINLLTSDGISVETRGDKDCPVGEGYFTLAIVPDYLRWTPGQNGNNNWQDDANWTAVDAMGRTLVGASGYVPLSHSNVIIPVRDDAQYPTITTTPDVLNNYDQNYQASNCHAIYFESGAVLGNQADLIYDRVFADLTLTAQRWYIVSMPIQEVVSGDMAFYTDGTDNTPFVPKSGEVNRTYNSSYISTFSKSYDIYNPENNSFERPEAEVASTGWSNILNTLAEPLRPAQAFSMMLWRGDDVAANATIRLPRPDTHYSYYYENGDMSPYGETITRDNDKVGKFAFTPNGSGDMTITLTNTTASPYFAFGNPTMAYIDLYRFLQANSSLISGTFYYHSGDQWMPLSTSMALYGSLTPSDEALFSLAPERGVMIRTADGEAATSLTLTLSNDMLSIYPYSTNVPSLAPARRSRTQTASSAMLTLTAACTFDDDATYTGRIRLGESTEATNDIRDGEDLLMMAANAGTDDDGYFVTPLNMYVLDQQHALSVDMRSAVTCLPILFSYGNGYTPGPTTRLWVHGADEFDYPIYLCDTLSGTRTRLQDGMYIDVATPMANTLRYYILGETESTDDPGVTTGGESVMNEPKSVLDLQIVPENNGRLSLLCNHPMMQVTAYDVVGRVMAHIRPNAESAALNLGEGVYLIEVHTGWGCITRKVFVK